MNKKAYYNILLWIGFLCFNALLNIPEWLFLLFQNDVFAENMNLSLYSFISAPQKSSLFQINGDYLLLFLPLALGVLHWNRSIIALEKEQRPVENQGINMVVIRQTTSVFSYVYFVLTSFIFLLLLYYNIYYYGYQSLYSVHPIFNNDWLIIKEILPTFFNELSVAKGTYLLVIGGVILLSSASFLGQYQLLSSFRKAKNHPYFWLFGGIIVSLIGFISQSNFKKKILNEENIITERSFIKWTMPNLIKSWTLERKEPLSHLKTRWIYDLYLEKPLLQKPNIYLLFIESYGAVATLSDVCAPKFDSLTLRLEQQLANNGWSITSNYTKSTVIGGRSWLALTTAMVGARIEDQIQYNGLLEEYQDFPHMIDYFNQQGYETIRASTMSSKNIDTFKMITVPNRFWGFDQRKMFTDIPYKGYRYDYYGGIPDQYTLGHLQEALLDTLEAPHFFTFITMNSHAPWSNPPPIVPNWKDLDAIQNPFPAGRPPLNMSIFHYWDLMEYELKVLVNFITEQQNENSIFIILGDHNPAGLEWKLFGKFNKWATPIHIISKDATFTQSFEQHGFTKGMTVDTSQYTIMRHMGLQSLLIRQLLENYGKEEEVLPEYLPWGLRGVRSEEGE